MSQSSPTDKHCEDCGTALTRGNLDRSGQEYWCQTCAKAGAREATADRAEWLAGKIPAYGDYAVEAAALLRKYAKTLRTPTPSSIASATRRCTCYVLPHADDCEIFVGITQSGDRVVERRAGVDRRTPSGLPAEDAELIRLLHQRYQDAGDSLARKAAWRIEELTMPPSAIGTTSRAELAEKRLLWLVQNIDPVELEAVVGGPCVTIGEAIDRIAEKSATADRSQFDISRSHQEKP